MLHKTKADRKFVSIMNKAAWIDRPFVTREGEVWMGLTKVGGMNVVEGYIIWTRLVYSRDGWLWAVADKIQRDGEAMARRDDLDVCVGSIESIPARLLDENDKYFKSLREGYST